MPACGFCCTAFCSASPAKDEEVKPSAPRAASPAPTRQDWETSESGRSAVSSVGAWSKTIAVEKERAIPGTALMSHQRERIRVRRQTAPEEILDIIYHQFELPDTEACAVVDRKGRAFIESRDLTVYSFDRLAHGATYHLVTQQTAPPPPPRSSAAHDNAAAFTEPSVRLAWSEPRWTYEPGMEAGHSAAPGPGAGSETAWERMKDVDKDPPASPPGVSHWKELVRREQQRLPAPGNAPALSWTERIKRQLAEPEPQLKPPTRKAKTVQFADEKPTKSARRTPPSTVPGRDAPRTHANPQASPSGNCGPLVRPTRRKAPAFSDSPASQHADDGRNPSPLVKSSAMDWLMGSPPRDAAVQTPTPPSPTLPSPQPSPPLPPPRSAAAVAPTSDADPAAGAARPKGPVLVAVKQVAHAPRQARVEIIDTSPTRRPQVPESLSTSEDDGEGSDDFCSGDELELAEPGASTRPLLGGVAGAPAGRRSPQAYRDPSPRWRSPQAAKRAEAAPPDDPWALNPPMLRALPPPGFFSDAQAPENTAFRTVLPRRSRSRSAEPTPRAPDPTPEPNKPTAGARLESRRYLEPTSASIAAQSPTGPVRASLSPPARLHRPAAAKKTLARRSPSLEVREASPPSDARRRHGYMHFTAGRRSASPQLSPPGALRAAGAAAFAQRRGPSPPASKRGAGSSAGRARRKPSRVPSVASTASEPQRLARRLGSARSLRTPSPTTSAYIDPPSFPQHRTRSRDAPRGSRSATPPRAHGEPPTPAYSEATDKDRSHHVRAPPPTRAPSQLVSPLGEALGTDRSTEYSLLEDAPRHMQYVPPTPATTELREWESVASQPPAASSPRSPLSPPPSTAPQPLSSTASAAPPPSIRSPPRTPVDHPTAVSILRQADVQNEASLPPTCSASIIPTKTHLTGQAGVAAPASTEGVLWVDSLSGGAGGPLRSADADFGPGGQRSAMRHSEAPSSGGGAGELSHSTVPSSAVAESQPSLRSALRHVAEPHSGGSAGDPSGNVVPSSSTAAWQSSAPGALRHSEAPHPGGSVGGPSRSSSAVGDTQPSLRSAARPPAPDVPASAPRSRVPSSSVGEPSAPLVDPGGPGSGMGPGGRMASRSPSRSASPYVHPNAPPSYPPRRALNGAPPPPSYCPPAQPAQQPTAGPPPPHSPVQYYDAAPPSPMPMPMPAAHPMPDEAAAARRVNPQAMPQLIQTAKRATPPRARPSFSNVQPRPAGPDSDPEDAPGSDTRDTAPAAREPPHDGAKLSPSQEKALAYLQHAAAGGTGAAEEWGYLPVPAPRLSDEAPVSPAGGSRTLHSPDSAPLLTPAGSVRAPSPMSVLSLDTEQPPAQQAMDTAEPSSRGALPRDAPAVRRQAQYPYRALPFSAQEPPRPRPSAALPPGVTSPAGDAPTPRREEAPVEQTPNVAVPAPDGSQRSSLMQELERLRGGAEAASGDEGDGEDEVIVLEQRSHSDAHPPRAGRPPAPRTPEVVLMSDILRTDPIPLQLSDTAPPVMGPGGTPGPLPTRRRPRSPARDAQPPANGAEPLFYTPAKYTEQMLSQLSVPGRKHPLCYEADVGRRRGAFRPPSLAPLTTPPQATPLHTPSERETDAGSAYSGRRVAREDMQTHVAPPVWQLDTIPCTTTAANRRPRSMKFLATPTAHDATPQTPVETAYSTAPSVQEPAVVSAQPFAHHPGSPEAFDVDQGALRIGSVSVSPSSDGDGAAAAAARAFPQLLTGAGAAHGDVLAQQDPMLAAAVPRRRCHTLPPRVPSRAASDSGGGMRSSSPSVLGSDGLPYEDSGKSPLLNAATLEQLLTRQTESIARLISNASPQRASSPAPSVDREVVETMGTMLQNQTEHLAKLVQESARPATPATPAVDPEVADALALRQAELSKAVADVSAMVADTKQERQQRGVDASAVEAILKRQTESFAQLLDVSMSNALTERSEEKEKDGGAVLDMDAVEALLRRQTENFSQLLRPGAAGEERAALEGLLRHHQDAVGEMLDTTRGALLAAAGAPSEQLLPAAAVEALLARQTEQLVGAIAAQQEQQQQQQQAQDIHPEAVEALTHQTERLADMFERKRRPAEPAVPAALEALLERQTGQLAQLLDARALPPSPSPSLVEPAVLEAAVGRQIERFVEAAGLSPQRDAERERSAVAHVEELLQRQAEAFADLARPAAAAAAPSADTPPGTAHSKNTSRTQSSHATPAPTDSSDGAQLVTPHEYMSEATPPAADAPLPAAVPSSVATPPLLSIAPPAPSHVQQAGDSEEVARLKAALAAAHAALEQAQWEAGAFTRKESVDRSLTLSADPTSMSSPTVEPTPASTAEAAPAQAKELEAAAKAPPLDPVSLEDAAKNEAQGDEDDTPLASPVANPDDAVASPLECESIPTTSSPWSGSGHSPRRLPVESESPSPEPSPQAEDGHREALAPGGDEVDQSMNSVMTVGPGEFDTPQIQDISINASMNKSIKSCHTVVSDGHGGWHTPPPVQLVRDEPLRDRAEVERLSPLFVSTEDHPIQFGQPQPHQAAVPTRFKKEGSPTRRRQGTGFSPPLGAVDPGASSSMDDIVEALEDPEAAAAEVAPPPPPQLQGTGSREELPVRVEGALSEAGEAAADKPAQRGRRKSRRISFFNKATEEDGRIKEDPPADPEPAGGSPSPAKGRNAPFVSISATLKKWERSGGKAEMAGASQSIDEIPDATAADLNVRLKIIPIDDKIRQPWELATRVQVQAQLARFRATIRSVAGGWAVVGLKDGFIQGKGMFYSIADTTPPFPPSYKVVSMNKGGGEDDSLVPIDFPGLPPPAPVPDDKLPAARSVIGEIGKDRAAGSFAAPSSETSGSRDMFEVGVYVHCDGLKKSTDINGRRGKVLGKQQQGMDQLIQCDFDGTLKAVRKANLTPVCASDTCDAPPKVRCTSCDKFYCASCKCTCTNEEKRAETWVKDEASHHCTGCGASFTFTRRRHHCRACGHLFCAECVKARQMIPGFATPQKVCGSCARSVTTSARTWVRDEDVTECDLCWVEFSQKKRRHHCRACGKIFCHGCSHQRMRVQGYMMPQRVCTRCASVKKKSDDSLSFSPRYLANEYEETEVRVTLHSAIHIPKTELLGSSNVFVRLRARAGKDKFIGKEVMWPVVAGGHEPSWFTTRLLGCKMFEVATLEFRVWNCDAVGEDQFIGDATATLASFKPGKVGQVPIRCQKGKHAALLLSIPTHPPTEKTVFFIRHGQSRWNAAKAAGGKAGVVDRLKETDHPLSALGCEQASILCSRIEEVLYDRSEPPLQRSLSAVECVYASPLTRAAQTAMIGVNPIIRNTPVERLILSRYAREKRNVGGLDTTSSVQGEKIVKRIREETDKLFEGNTPNTIDYGCVDASQVNVRWWNDKAETKEEFTDRLKELTNTIQYSPYETLMVVGHSHCFRGLVNHLISPRAALPDGITFSDLRQQKLNNCGIMRCVLDFTQAHPLTSVELLFDTHLVGDKKKAKPGQEQDDDDDDDEA